MGVTCFLVSVESEGRFVAQHVVEDPIFFIGRSLEAALAFNDPNISRNHLLVRARGGRVWIEDQDSSNGTYLNGKKLSPKKLVSVEVGDRIRLGTSNISLSINLAEKAFPRDLEALKKLIPEGEHEKVKDILEAAHKEADRLVLLAQSDRDHLLKLEEEKNHQRREARRAEVEAEIQALKEEAHQALRAEIEEERQKLLEKAKADLKQELDRLEVQKIQTQFKVKEFREVLDKEKSGSSSQSKPQQHRSEGELRGSEGVPAKREKGTVSAEDKALRVGVGLGAGSSSKISSGDSGVASSSASNSGSSLSSGLTSKSQLSAQLSSGGGTSNEGQEDEMTGSILVKTVASGVSELTSLVRGQMSSRRARWVWAGILVGLVCCALSVFLYYHMQILRDPVGVAENGAPSENRAPAEAVKVPLSLEPRPASVSTEVSVGPAVGSENEKKKADGKGGSEGTDGQGKTGDDDREDNESEDG